MAILKIRDENGKITEVLAIKGENGVDGHTPVKGTDYWTEEDKQELANDIANRINVGTDKFALLSDFNTLNEEVINARDGEENLLTKLNRVVTDYQNVDNNLYDMIYPPSKNILRLPEYSISAEDNSGVSITINENLISVEGTAAEDVRLVFPIEKFVLPAGTYSYAVKNLNSDFTTGATIYIKDDNYTNISNVFTNQNVNYNKKVFTIAEDKIIAHMSVTVTSGTEIKQTFNLQLEAGETSTDYVSPNERLFGGELTNDVDTLKLATVTASVFGAVGDGETDDTDALQRAIDYCSENYKVLKLESGKKYLISKILQFNGKSIYLDGNFATIKANKRLSSIDVTLSDGSTKSISPMIYVDCLNINDNFNTTLNEEQNYRMQVVKNLIIDCNGVVNDGIRAVRGRKVHIDNIVVINPVNNGIIINTGGWENMISNIHVSRYLESLGGTGIYIEGSDNVIDKVVVIGCQYGVINVGGDNHYSRVHPWSTTKAMENLRNSVSFGCFGSYCSFNQCMGDSTNRIFEFKYNARAMISNCANTWSDGYVGSADKNPYLFYFVDDEEGKNHTLRGKGVIVSTSYFKPKISSDYPEFKTYFSNLSEDEEPILIDKVSDIKNWTNAPKSIENLIESKLDDTDGVIKTKHIAEQAITTERIAAGSVTMSKLAKDSVTGSAILNKSITDEKIADGAVGQNQIANNAVIESHITNGAITQQKLAEELLLLITNKEKSSNKLSSFAENFEDPDKFPTVMAVINYLKDYYYNYEEIDGMLADLGGGGSSGGITYEQVKTLIEPKEDISNKITAFDSLLTDKDKYPTAIAVINYLKEYYYDANEVDGLIPDIKDGKDGVGIENIETSISSEDNGLNPIVITLTDGTEYTVYTKNGSKGSQGTSVKVKSVATSLEDDGNNIVKFTDGSTLTIKNGSKGSQGEAGASGTNGKDGYTPVKGTDYWTNEDKAELKAMIQSDLSQLEPNFANSIEECTDTSKVYVLPDGYIYGFMAVESVGGIEEVTEQITGEFTEDYRLSTSSGSLSALAGAITTPLIDITGYGDKFTIHLDSANGGSAHTVQWAKANQSVTGNSMCLYKDGDLVLAGFTGSTSLSGITYNVNAADDVDISFDVSAVPIDAQGFTHVRFSGVTGRADKVAVSVTYEKEIQGGLKPDFINLADPTSDSWKNGYRINSSLQYVEANGACTTNWFPCKTGSVIRVKGLAMARKDCNEGGIEVGGYSGFGISADGVTPIGNDKASEEHVYQLLSRDADGIETLDLTNYTYGAGSFNYVCLTGRVENTEEDIIITVDEEIKYSQTIGYAWTNTGHAFVPADYENRIIDLEDDVADLKNITTTSNGVPVYVIGEAEVVADKVLAIRNAYRFVGGAISDTHTTGSDTSATSVLHAGMGIDVVNGLTQLDLVTNFGDVMVGYLDDTYKEGFKHVKSSLNSVSKAVPYIQLQGNHDQLSADTTEEAQQKYFAYIGANNVGTVTDWDNRFRNYGYRDFDDQKMRVIYLNTADVSEVENTKDVGISSEQYSWFINTALDFSNKDNVANWGFIVCSHHPLNWYQLDNLLVILNAYKGKTSGSITTDDTSIAYDFTNATAELIAHFHGHLHNFRAEKLGENEITTITIPNACFGRNNEYGTNSSYNETVHTNFGDADENGNQRQFNKTANTAEDTAFNVVVVDRQNRKIHCFNYGAGIDREILY